MELTKKNARVGKKNDEVSHGVPMFYKDTAILHGERGATFYGCRRILRYSPERICFCIGKKHVFVCGKGLLCTSFNAGCVSVEGQIDRIGYCKNACAGECTESVRAEEAT